MDLAHLFRSEFHETPPEFSDFIEIIRQECRKAISVLRSFQIWLADSNKHNVLYSQDSTTVTLVDFESIGQCTGEEANNLDAPEILAIFGPAARAESLVGG
jgi:hypothetical protein